LNALPPSPAFPVHGPSRELERFFAAFVTCPVALYPATSEADKISFNQINKNTGHRIKYLKVDADTGEEVASEDIV
jgi:DNA end-binding protein Ku